MSELLNFPIKTAKKLVHTRHFKKPRTAGDIQNALESPPSPIISIPPFPAAVEPPFSNEATSDDDSSDNEDPYDSDSNDSYAEEAGPSSSAPQGSAMDGIREELFVSQLSSLQRIDGSLSDAVLAEKSSFEVQLAACSCPGCQAGPCQPSPAPAVSVYLVTCNAAHSVQVPRLYCSTCNSSFYPRPTVLACLPGNRNAWDFGRTLDVVPVWFHLSLLSMLDALQYHAKADRIYSLLQALEQHWDFMGSRMSTAAEQPSRPSSDTLRRQLSTALQEYQILDTRMATQVEQLPDWPASACRPCSACNFNDLHTVHFDVCFRLPNLRRKGCSLCYPAPPNRRLMHDNSMVLEACSLPSSEQLQQQQQQQQQAVGEAGQGQAHGDGPSEADGWQQEQEQQQEQQPQQQQEQNEQQQQEQGQQEPDAAAAGTVDGSACSQFRADQLYAPDSKKYLITGLGAAVCRHGHILGMLNCFSGEKHGYAIVALSMLLLAGIVMQFWWYDINCRWERSFKKWLSLQPAAVQEKARHIRFPIPPFHLYAHQESCRVKYGHTHMEGAGNGTGDRCEPLNAELGPHGLSTKYMNPFNRELRLERMAFLYTRYLDAHMPALLKKMFLRVQNELVECQQEGAKARDDLCKMVGQARNLVQRQEQEQVVDQLVEQASSAAVYSGQASVLDWRGEYVKARLTVERVSRVYDDDSMTPPLSLLMSITSLSDSFKITKKMGADAKKNMDNLATRYCNGRHPDLGAAEVQEGLNQWVAAEVRAIGQYLVENAAMARYANLLITKLAQRRSAQRTVMRRKHGLHAKVKRALLRLQDWVKWANAVKEAGVVRDWQPGVQLLLQHAEGVQLADVLEGRWEPLSGPVEVLGGSKEPLLQAAQKLWILQLKAHRLREEVALLHSEEAQLKQHLQQRLAALGAAVAEAGTAHSILYMRERQRTLDIMAAADKLLSSNVDVAALPEEVWED